MFNLVYEIQKEKIDCARVPTPATEHQSEQSERVQAIGRLSFAEPASV
jgi:hypothetical protein